MRFGRRQAGAEGSEAVGTVEADAPVVSGGGVADRAEAAGPGTEPALVTLDEAELSARTAALQDLLDMMRPAVQMDGGDLSLVDVDYVAGVVEVRLEGACGSCAISSATLQGGVERLLRERLPWVTEVRGDVDDSLDPFESAALGRGAYVPRFE